jgi:predicted transcriptional regulator
MGKPEPSIFHAVDSEAEAKSAAEADADALAGRVVPHAEVAEWLKTWGTSEEGPPPARWGLDD